jgi:inhibitor of KinA
MRIRPLGDSAFIVDDLGAPAHLVAEALEAAQSPFIAEAVASYDSVGIYCVSPGVDKVTIRIACLNLIVDSPSASKTHLIPICYDLGEDIDLVASDLGMTVSQVAEAHSSQCYQCFAIGFCPGFPYLGYLPPSLEGIPRKASPRIRIEPGSVGITGRQTGIYPLPVPGGWSLIGRTPLTIVDPETDYFPIRAGDEIQFTRIDEHEFNKLKGERL